MSEETIAAENAMDEAMEQKWKEEEEFLRHYDLRQKWLQLAEAAVLRSSRWQRLVVRNLAERARKDAAPRRKWRAFALDYLDPRVYKYRDGDSPAEHRMFPHDDPNFEYKATYTTLYATPMYQRIRKAPWHHVVYESPPREHFPRMSDDDCRWEARRCIRMGSAGTLTDAMILEVQEWSQRTFTETEWEAFVEEAMNDVPRVTEHVGNEDLLDY